MKRGPKLTRPGAPSYTHGFAYRINYDKEIAADQAEIDRLERCLVDHVFYVVPPNEHWTATTLLAAELLYAAVPARYAPEYAGAIGSRERMGLTDADVAAVALFEEWDIPGIAAPEGSWYSRAARIQLWLATKYGTWIEPEATLRLQLKKARTALARHRRNRAKYAA